MDDIIEELSEIRSGLIANVLEYVETGIFKNRTHVAYVNAYSKVMELADIDTNGIDTNGKHLYMYYKNTILEYTVSVVIPELLNLQGVDLLKKFALRWQNHKMLVYWMKRLFNYIDRYYVKCAKVDCLFLAGVNIFKDKVFAHIKVAVRTALLDQINSERNGTEIDTNIIKETLLCFTELSCTKFIIKEKRIDDRVLLFLEGTASLTVYREDFEERFISESLIFYRAKGQNWLMTMSWPEYLHATNKAFADEEKRLQAYLDPSSKEKLMEILIDQLVTKICFSLSDTPGTGFENIDKRIRNLELGFIFHMLKYRENLITLADQLTTYIDTKGTLIVIEAKLKENPIEFTTKLLEIKAEVDEIVEYSFESHFLFRSCRDRSFKNFIGKFSDSVHYIASYCNHEMTKGLKGVSEADTETRLNALSKLIPYLSNIDAFMYDYTRQLSKRISDETSLSDEAEQCMISKLKVEFGYNFVKKISDMCQDKSESKILMNEFKTLDHRGAPDGILLNMQTSRHGYLPALSVDLFVIPDKLDRCFNLFKDFYLSKYPERSLTVMLNNGTCELGNLLVKISYKIIVSPYQAAILLLFNKTNTTNLAQIKEDTKLSGKTIKAHLLPFFNPKNKLLTKESNGKTLTEEESITLNLEFNSVRLEVNFIPKIVKEAEATNEEDDRGVENGRQYTLDSVIMKIAKERRTIRHQELETEIIRQIKHFKPQPRMIKSRIESLIERELLARCEEDRCLYTYLP